MIKSFQIKSAIKIETSPTVAINTLAMQKIKAGEKVYNLSAGEPMLNTPNAIIKAAKKALDENKTHYPPVAGIPELRQAAADWMNDLYGANYKAENTIVVNGGKFGLYLLLQAMVKPGDEVLIPSPYWVSYPSMVKLYGGVPKIIEPNNKGQWKIDPASLEKACTAKTKYLILNNGANPTGIIYDKNELAALLEVAQEHGLVVISDEVYSGLTYDGKKFVSCASLKRNQDNLVVIQSCSKNFAMTGWRVGFVFADQSAIKVLTGLMSQSTSGVTTISQWATLAALNNYRKLTEKINVSMRKRRDVFVETFNKFFNAGIKKPEAGLYVFIPMEKFGTKEKLSVEFCKTALDKANVAMVPGLAFGQEGYVRCSFGADEKTLKDGIKALAGSML